jgi:predicted Mrr-cat superfamily restriction endonuclease
MVEKARTSALKMMKDAGFEISDTLQVLVDPKLSFMGYSTKRDGKDTIVVAGRALKFGMIEVCSCMR